jgi:hypothetical protein
VDTWQRSSGFDGEASDAECVYCKRDKRVYCKHDKRVWCPKKRPVKGLTTIFVCGAINRSVASLSYGLAPLELSVHALGVLGEPLTHLCLQECESITSECDSSALHHDDCIEWH